MNTDTLEIKELTDDEHAEAMRILAESLAKTGGVHGVKWLPIEGGLAAKLRALNPRQRRNWLKAERRRLRAGVRK